MWGCHLADYAISVTVESQNSKLKTQNSKDLTQRALRSEHRGHGDGWESVWLA